MTITLEQINYLGASALFVIGLYIVLVQGNLIRKILGINLMETAVFLVFVTIGAQGNPLPAALILTGIVVAVSITVYALSLVVRIHRTYGTIELGEILMIRNREHHE